VRRRRADVDPLGRLLHPRPNCGGSAGMEQLIADRLRKDHAAIQFSQDIDFSDENQVIDRGWTDPLK
jgi:hypothetical protein